MLSSRCEKDEEESKKAEESNDNHIFIVDNVREKVLEELLRFIYTGKLHLTTDYKMESQLLDSSRQVIGVLKNFSF